MGLLQHVPMLVYRTKDFFSCFQSLFNMRANISTRIGAQGIVGVKGTGRRAEAEMQRRCNGQEDFIAFFIMIDTPPPNLPHWGRSLVPLLWEGLGEGVLSIIVKNALGDTAIRQISALYRDSAFQEDRFFPVEMEQVRCGLQAFVICCLRF